jgi:hypothetical protein
MVERASERHFRQNEKRAAQFPEPPQPNHEISAEVCFCHPHYWIQTRLMVAIFNCDRD